MTGRAELYAAARRMPAPALAPTPAIAGKGGGMLAAIGAGLLVVGAVLFGGGGRGALRLHRHDCPACGTAWQHDDRMFNNVAAHTCPGCGAIQWVKTL